MFLHTGHAEKPHALLDKLIVNHNIKNDAQLSRELGVKPPTISKIRSRTNAVGCEVILSIHERFGMPVREIRKLIEEAGEQMPLRAAAAANHSENAQQ